MYFYSFRKFALSNFLIILYISYFYAISFTIYNMCNEIYFQKDQLSRLYVFYSNGLASNVLSIFYVYYRRNELFRSLYSKNVLPRFIKYFIEMHYTDILCVSKTRFFVFTWVFNSTFHGTPLDSRYRRIAHIIYLL